MSSPKLHKAPLQFIVFLKFNPRFHHHIPPVSCRLLSILLFIVWHTHTHWTVSSFDPSRQETPLCCSFPVRAHPSVSSAPRRTRRPAGRKEKGRHLSKYTFCAQCLRPRLALLSCPLTSRCLAPALVHCSWRHTQHGGQGDSVNISYQILILKGGKAATGASDAEDSMSVRTRGFKARVCHAAEPPFRLSLHLCIGASLPASHRQL